MNKDLQFFEPLNDEAKPFMVREFLGIRTYGALCDPLFDAADILILLNLDYVNWDQDLSNGYEKVIGAHNRPLLTKLGVRKACLSSTNLIANQLDLFITYTCRAWENLTEKMLEDIKIVNNLYKSCTDDITCNDMLTVMELVNHSVFRDRPIYKFQVK